MGGLRALLLLLRHCVGHGDVEDSMMEEMEERREFSSRMALLKVGEKRIGSLRGGIWWKKGVCTPKGTCMYLSRLGGKRDPEEDPEEGLGSWRGKIQAVRAEYYR
jgi:hypothetical protein